MRVIGLPGNPVSCYVCAYLFLVVADLRPLRPRDHYRLARETALLGRDVAANDQREDYLRARIEEHADGTLIATPVDHQDLATGNLAAARALVMSAIRAGVAKGTACDILRLPR